MAEIVFTPASGAGGSGEANTASNVGTGEGLYKTKTGVDLEFRNLKDAGNSRVTVDTDAVNDDVTFDLTANGVDDTILADMDAERIKGRDVGAGTGDPQDLTPAEVRDIINVEENANNYSHPNHTGDVASVGDGAQTIADNAVTNAKLNDMAQNLIKGRISAGAGDPEDLTGAQVGGLHDIADHADTTATGTQLNTLVGGTDTDLHGHTNFSEDTDGFAPGPTAADIAGDYVLQADGDWVAQSGGSGEANTGSDLGGTAGTFKQKTGVDLEFRGISDGGNSDISVTENATDIGISVVPANIAHNDLGSKQGGAAGEMYHLSAAGYAANAYSTASAGADNRIARTDGTSNVAYQDSGATLDDSGNVTLAGNITLSTANATVDGVDLTAHVANADAHHAETHALTTHSNIATDTVVGRDTAGTGAPEILTMAQLRKMLVETYYDQSFANPLVTDADNGFKFDVELSGDTTVNVPSNLTEGMLIEFRFRQDSAGGHTVTWHANYNDGEITDTSVDETAYAITYVLCKYNEIATEMDIVAVNRGYPSS